MEPASSRPLNSKDLILITDNPADARFIGSPVDYIIFDGLTEVADEKSREIRIVFMDVKKGTGSLTRTQRVIKKAVENKAVSWETLKIADT